jgi:hypothetical protein
MAVSGAPQQAAAHLDGLDSVKVPPNSIEAEQAVLGGLMLDNVAWDQIADRIVEQDFYRSEHRQVFRAIASLAERNDPLDAVTVSEWLARNDSLEQVGGLAYLGASVHALLQRTGADERKVLLNAAVPRFSAIAVLSVGTLAITGLYGAWIQVNVPAAVATPYGFTLVAKTLTSLRATTNDGGAEKTAA